MEKTIKRNIIVLRVTLIHATNNTMSKQTCIIFKTLYIYILLITSRDMLIYFTNKTYTVEKYVHLDMQPLTRCTKRIFGTEYITLSITSGPKTD